MFAGLKKKKKKTVTLDVDEAAPEAAPAAEEAPAPEAEPAPAADEPAADGGDMFADLKKKKKKKKEIPLDLEASADAGPSGADDLDMPIKKKKSKKAATDFEKELGEMDGDAEAQVEIEGDLGDDVFANGAGAVDAGADSNELGKESWIGSDRDYQYPELLSRFFTLLHAHNPELAGEKRRYTIAPPQVSRDGTKKTLFANIPDICRRMHRQPEHVIQFLFSELGTTGSVDGAQRLVIKGRYTQKQIETVLRKYIVEYVTCKICKSPDTLLGKENRLYFMTCESCGSRRSVSAIKSGFQAQIGKRKLQKA